MYQRTHPRGFTLVEILIVVVILGILGAIVVPQFTSASADARRAALSHQLQTIRKQIQLYSLHHEGNWPKMAGADWSDLTTPSIPDGAHSAAYLHSAPMNMLNNSFSIVNVGSDLDYGDPVTTSGMGFIYNPASGLIWATNSKGDRVFNEQDPYDPNN